MTTHRWEKCGLIYAPQGNREWNQTHAQVPTLDIVNDEVWRIYFASRDARNRSYISYIEVEAGNPRRVLYEHGEPLLPLGEPGSFDDDGMMPSWVVNQNGRKYLYYIGWNVRSSVPFHNSIGLAVSDDGGQNFRRAGLGPIMDRTLDEPYFCGTSCVLFEEGIWKNWYMNCTKWENINGRAEPFYHLKYAESIDGVNWLRKNEIAIDYSNSAEGGIVRASVWKRNSTYHMWYCHRAARDYRSDSNRSYRIGYASSVDGRQWIRKDPLVGIDVSPQGWDKEMIAYPYVLSWKDKLFMFYNGNGFGKSGIGYATMSADF